MSLSWTDQPAELAECPILASVAIASGIAEVRQAPDREGSARFYVTVGTLFGSETVVCYGATAAFKVLELASRKETGKSKALPAGAFLVEHKAAAPKLPIHCPKCSAERGVAIPAKCPHVVETKGRG